MNVNNLGLTQITYDKLLDCLSSSSEILVTDALTRLCEAMIFLLKFRAG